MHAFIAVVGAHPGALWALPTAVGRALLIAEGTGTLWVLLGLVAVVVWLCRRVRGLEGGAQRAAAQMRDLIGEAEALSQAIADGLSPEGAATLPTCPRRASCRTSLIRQSCLSSSIQRSLPAGPPAMPMQAVAARYGATERAIQPPAGKVENKDEEDLLTVVAGITQVGAGPLVGARASVGQIVKEESTSSAAMMGKSLDTERPLQGDGASLNGSTRIRRSRRQAAATAEPFVSVGQVVEEGRSRTESAPVSIGSRTRRSGAGRPAGGTRLFTQTDQEQTDAVGAGALVGALDRAAAREKGMDPVGVALQRRLAARRARI